MCIFHCHTLISQRFRETQNIYAHELIHRFAYGAAVRHLEKDRILQISVPLLRYEDMQQEINNTVLEANRKRTEAYNLEQEALRVLDAKVIFAR